MTKKKIALAIIVAILILPLTAIFVPKPIAPDDQTESYGFHETLPDAETAARSTLVQTAVGWLGCKETDGTHKPIIDLYNSHRPLARDYTVQYDDEWCATFVSAVAIQCGYTDFIPTECGCQRQIGLFKELGTWVEADDYLPLPGDIIYYCRKDTSGNGDCTGWSDHVGIVVGTAGDRIKVIEGNNGSAVAYRYIRVDAPGIRGYATPDYSQLVGK